MIYNGSCQCESVKIQLEAKEVTKAICHCLECQKRTASAFSVNIIASREHFKVTQGQTKTYEYMSDSGKPYITNFCGNCGSTLFGEPQRLPDVVSIKAGCLDNKGTNLGAMDAEVYVERRVDYLSPFEGMKQVEGMI